MQCIAQISQIDCKQLSLSCVLLICRVWRWERQGRFRCVSCLLRSVCPVCSGVCVPSDQELFWSCPCSWQHRCLTGIPYREELGESQTESHRQRGARRVTDWESQTERSSERCSGLWVVLYVTSQSQCYVVCSRPEQNGHLPPKGKWNVNRRRVKCFKNQVLGQKINCWQRAFHWVSGWVAIFVSAGESLSVFIFCLFLCCAGAEVFYLEDKGKKEEKVCFRALKICGDPSSIHKYIQHCLSTHCLSKQILSKNFTKMRTHTRTHIHTHTQPQTWRERSACVGDI